MVRPISRGEALSRAASWREVPYSQTAFHTNSHGTYRTDCSGFVSMVFGLPDVPHGGLNTVDLLRVSTRIAKDELLPADVLIDPHGDRTTRHVVLFGAWVDAGRTHYLALEQCAGLGTVRRTLAYPYQGRSAGYLPYRLDHVLP
ncbi:hypothetical protein [Saccharothrix longispora]|uniref:hypothetical protein n=1 Tax=Saccharothrix longispora TaxID=33920 RepID=UPI0028FD9EB2|nr:hypothetical protein [Saccharothrix longispora]MBY8848399.1 hypothetical protein [Saccharothrix sp. MB29]MDU0292352.1 hypothetical protein [Saccharothrix longispora]